MTRRCRSSPCSSSRCLNRRLAPMAQSNSRPLETTKVIARTREDRDDSRRVDGILGVNLHAKVSGFVESMPIPDRGSWVTLRTGSCGGFLRPNLTRSELRPRRSCRPSAHKK